MEIDIQLSKEDWLKFNQFVQKRTLKKLKGFVDGIFGNLVIWLILIALFAVLFLTVKVWHWPTAISVATVFVAMIGLFLLNIYRLQSSLMPSEHGSFIGKHHFVFDERGIHSEGKGYSGFHSWDVVQSIEHPSGMVILFLDTTFGYIFPEDQLENTAEFIKRINQLRPS